MFTHIKTSKENRESVSKLSRKLNLGTENHIARIALTYSLSKDRKMDLTKISNSAVKEYFIWRLFDLLCFTYMCAL